MSSSLRVCRICGYTGDDSNFYPKRRICKKCRKEQVAKNSKIYDVINHDKILERKRRYRAKNKEKFQAYFKKWYLENRERQLLLHKQRYQRNREAILQQCREYNKTEAGKISRRNKSYRRRALLKAAEGSFRYEDFVAYAALVFDNKCNCCGKKLIPHTKDFTVDHIIALHNGGSNNIENLQLLCKSCNSGKQARITKKQYRIYLKGETNEEARRKRKQ